MKKIINGRSYNTDTARKVGSWSNNLGAGDFNYCSEILYQKRTGEYFLFGCGGAMTIYNSTAEGGGITGGSEIIPFSESQAKEWAMSKLSNEEYLELFGHTE
jgi:hypothetical protein